MIKNKLNIFVACHKPGSVFHNDVYIRIHAGRTVSNYKNEMADMIGDDTGDNISEKNPMYCELTVQYWAWKNLHNVEYIGFCHYRRFFKELFTPGNVDCLLGNHDMIVLRFKYRMPIYWEIIRFVGAEDYTILLMVLKKKYPEYEQTMIKYLCGNVLYPKNMFVCKKALFDKYAEWLFDILFECEKHMRLSPYTRAKRNLAYMGEYLLTVYIMHNHLNTKFTKLKKNEIKQKMTFGTIISNIKRPIGALLRFIRLRKKPMPQSLEHFYLDEVLVGFEQDNIRI